MKSIWIRLIFVCVVIIRCVTTGLFGEENQYWQQEVNYTIDVTLIDSLHELDGYILMEYINNSPDTLNEIYIHLWPNAYKDHSTAFAQQQFENGETKFYFSSEDERGYIDGLDFRVNDQLVHVEEDPNHIDICKIRLNSPLFPEESITISTPFHVKIPKNFSRLGYEDQGYQISQWYPKPAVYDNNGWHPMPYLDQGEFYSEFGSFDVKITLPANYVVGATGILQNKDEWKWLDERAQKTARYFTVDSILGIGINEFEKKILNDQDQSSNNKTKTLHYIQDNIHDFAWFADVNYFVVKDEVELPHSKKKVTTMLLFTGDDKLLKEWWERGLDDIKNAVYYYSLWLGDYPYDQVTAVTGALSAGGGMEYPMITVTERMAIIHEVGHNWFYGILGTNERSYPYLDEGLNTFYDQRVEKTTGSESSFIEYMNISGIGKLFGINSITNKEFCELLYLINARRNQDQPIDLHAAEYSNFNYGAIVYFKSVIAFEYLYAYLGEDEFDKIMKGYYEKWKFRHPGPDDFRKAFEEGSPKDLEWFFNHTLHTTMTSDYKIRKVSTDTVAIGSSGFKEITVIHGGVRAKNHGGLLKGPFPITAYKDGKPIHTVWYDGFWGKMKVLFPDGNYDSYKLDDPHYLLERNRNNNNIRAKGLFKKIEPLKFRFLAGMENPSRTQLFFTPVLGANYYDKTMMGMAFYNSILPSKPFEYVLMPMYSFGTESLVGMGKLGRYWYPDKIFQTINLSFLSKSFSYENMPFPMRYVKLSPELSLQFKKKHPRSSVSKGLTFRHINISKEDYEFDNGVFKKEEINYWVNSFSFNITNSRVIDPFSIDITIHDGEKFIKSSIEGNYEITLYPKHKHIDLRIFAGKYLYNTFSTGFGGDFTYTTTGTTGPADYTYDELYFGRNEASGLFPRQLIISDGGFKVTPDEGQSGVGETDNWLTAFNIKTSLPYKIPFKLFADAVLYGERKYIISGNSVKKEYKSKTLYDAGILFEIIPGIFELYFPLMMSADFGKVENLNSLLKKMTFTLRLTKLNPFDKLRNFSF